MLEAKVAQGGLFLTLSIQICALDAAPSGDRDLLAKYSQDGGSVLQATPWQGKGPVLWAMSSLGF